MREVKRREQALQGTRAVDHLPSYMAVDVSGLMSQLSAQLPVASESEASTHAMAALAPVAEMLQTLTPRLMHWSESIWLLDLSVCESYWLARAAALGTDVISTMRALLREIAAAPLSLPGADVAAQPATLLEQTGTQTSSYAALADHPWQALLLLHQMRERGLVGLISCSRAAGATGASGLAAAGFGDSLYREISWATWWRCGEELASHLGQEGALARQSVSTSSSYGERHAPGRRSFDPALFRRQCLQMQRAVKRLGLRVPAQLQDVAPLAIKRRFGATQRDMWEWAYGAAPTSTIATTSTLHAAHHGLFADLSDALFDSGFPWQSFVFASLPQVQRDLDDPLCEWQHIEPLLGEDLDRLCALSSMLSGERVVSLEWCLVLRDLSSHVVPICFRHPHSLHLEKGAHPTALLQALYSFEAVLLRRSRAAARTRSVRPSRGAAGAKGRELVPIESAMTPIIAWSLTVKERLTVPRRSVGLFGDQVSVFEAFCSSKTNAEGHASSPGGQRGACNYDDLTLLQLENKLKLPLAAYRLSADWLPEDSFTLQSAAALSRSASSASAGPLQEAACQPSLEALGQMRPLYLYTQPVPFTNKGRSSLWQFSERTMNKWWQPPIEDESQLHADAKARAAPITSTNTLQRDYYRLTDAEARMLWVFKNGRGQWFVHGVFA